MKKIAWWLLLLPLVLFLVPQRLPVMLWAKKTYPLPPITAFACDPLTLLPLPKDELPDTFADLLTHPWIAKQTALKNAVPEMVRDLESIARFCALFPDCDGEQLTSNLIDTLESLQTNIPFHFSDQLYNVLWIAEKPTKCPFSFRVVKRLYIGESHLGLPLYLDIRRFDDEDHDAILAWHCEELASGFTPFRAGMIGCGEGKVPGHGWETNHRVIYFQTAEQSGQLYMAYVNVAEVDWEIVEPWLSTLQ